MNAQARGARAARLYKRAKSKLISLDHSVFKKPESISCPPGLVISR